jgi:hypothetical protein
VAGVWFVRALGAPFGQHVFTFHTDGTVVQSNPDAGNPNTSDSNGMGIWVEKETERGCAVTGKFVEVTADRTTHGFASFGVVTFTLDVAGDRMTGTAEAVFYDIDSRPLGAPAPARLEGWRVTLD